MTEEHRLCCESSCSRRAAPHRVLCWGCRDRLARMLDPHNAGGVDPQRAHLGHLPGGITWLYREAATVGGPVGGERAGEHFEHARVDEHAIAIRDVRTSTTGPGLDDDGWRAVEQRLTAGHDDPLSDPLRGPRSVVAALGGWARVVHDERGDPLPVLARPPWVEVRAAASSSLLGVPGRARVVRRPQPARRPDVQAVESLCRWLHARVDWVCAQPWVDEALTDLREVAAQLRSAGGDPGGRYIGPCSATVDPVTGEPDEGSATLCGAPLHAPVAGSAGPGPVELPSLRCERCGARWSGAALLDVAWERGLIGLHAPPRCPVHDLPRERQVRIRVRGTLLEGTAAQVCTTWHTEHEETA